MSDDTNQESQVDNTPVNDETETTVETPTTSTASTEAPVQTTVEEQKEPVENVPTMDDESTSSTDETAKKTKTFVVKDQNTIQDYSTNITTRPYSDEEDALYLSSDYPDAIAEELEAHKEALQENDEASQHWKDVISNSTQSVPYLNQYKTSLEGSDRYFVQAIKSKSGPLHGVKTRFSAKEGENLKGEAAMLRVMEAVGIGSTFQAPLWHTGIWLTFKAPPDTALAELYRQIIAEKIDLGRRTYGLSLSSVSGITTDLVVDFALRYVYQCTLDTREDLKNIISSHDLDSLLWGLACVIWPNGFQYQQACTNDVENCKNVIKDILNVSKLQWPDSGALTDRQVMHMSKRRNKQMTIKDVEEYQNELLRIQPTSVPIKTKKDNLTLTLKVPTLGEFIDSSNLWISSTIAKLNAAFMKKADDDVRNDYVREQAQASSLNQYSHFVKSITFGDNNIIEDQETIYNTLTHLSSDDNIREDIMKAIFDFKDNTVIAVIGIPGFECPKCKKEQTADKTYPRHTNVLPLQVMTTFFTLVELRLRGIQLRDISVI